MATGIWAVLAEAERLAWSFTPFEHVGPLRFGMTHDQARAAVRGSLSVAASLGASDGDGWAEFWLERRTEMPGRLAVTTYYDESIGLAGIVINALRGPQVTLDGMRLVAQTPSRMEREIADYLKTCGHELWYSQQADPWSPQLGLVLRIQRAGDIVLSRPVMVAEAWADRCGDTTEGLLPMREWTTFEW
ncbi:hypothetical protein HDA40_008159 [Hamadaea flava]|uniref:Uncharacterized protein n=1 Tax=Hamadaea flava TaxID=1742688 RepID=A0ABV8LQ28_9ACTN|nr:hypothetical protein [Hamadaea flava]MCP2329652.1 hypothetical protein [Hamadaea flava]